MRLVVLSFIFCFSLSLSVPNLLSARPTSTETKEESALLALISKRKHVLKKKIHEKKQRPLSSFFFFFFFFLRVSVKGKKKSAGFFLSLSYYLQSRSMSPMLSFSRVCQKKQERKLYLGNKSKGEILPISFLPFRRSWASQVEKNQKKTLSLFLSFSHVPPAEHHPLLNSYLFFSLAICRHLLLLHPLRVEISHLTLSLSSTKQLKLLGLGAELLDRGDDAHGRDDRADDRKDPQDDAHAFSGLKDLDPALDGEDDLFFF